MSAFLDGYESLRPFTDEQRKDFPYLYAILAAFELGKMCYDKNCPETLLKENRTDDIRKCMKICMSVFQKKQKTLITF